METNGESYYEKTKELKCIHHIWLSLLYFA